MEPIRTLPVAPPVFPGLYAASVQDVDDQDHLGRIKVTVPAVFDLDSPEAAVWARPCFPWGHVFVPEVHDFVWVAFENGDPASPVWLGSWFASGTMPADAAVSPPVKRLIRSKSGHQILLDDTSGSEQVVITDKTGSIIELKTTSVRIHAAQDLTIEAPGKNLTITAQAIVLQAPSVDVQAGP